MRAKYATRLTHLLEDNTPGQFCGRLCPRIGYVLFHSQQRLCIRCLRAVTGCDPPSAVRLARPGRLHVQLTVRRRISAVESLYCPGSNRLNPLTHPTSPVQRAYIRHARRPHGVARMETSTAIQVGLSVI